jgi:hypothetical protein
MSRKGILSAALDDQLLFELESLFTGDETARTMIVSSNVMAAIMPPFPDTAIGVRRGELRAWLDSFIEGGEISVSEDPHNKPPETMLARVRPIESDFWSIRVTLPENTPGIRALGAFTDTDEFVALTWELREDMVDFDGDVWDAILGWKDIFGDEPPHAGDSLDEYLSNYYAL